MAKEERLIRRSQCIDWIWAHGYLTINRIKSRHPHVNFSPSPAEQFYPPLHVYVINIPNTVINPNQPM
jgi:hypothetical protein